MRLDEDLEWELSNFARLLKLRPGVIDDHVLAQQVTNNLWFRQLEYEKNALASMTEVNLTFSEEDLTLMPHSNAWLYLSPTICTLGEGAFNHAPAMIEKKPAYLKALLNETERYAVDA